MGWPDSAFVKSTRSKFHIPIPEKVQRLLDSGFQERATEIVTTMSAKTFERIVREQGYGEEYGACIVFATYNVHFTQEDTEHDVKCMVDGAIRHFLRLFSDNVKLVASWGSDDATQLQIEFPVPPHPQEKF